MKTLRRWDGYEFRSGIVKRIMGYCASLFLHGTTSCVSRCLVLALVICLPACVDRARPEGQTGPGFGLLGSIGSVITSGRPAGGNGQTIDVGQSFDRRVGYTDLGSGPSTITDRVLVSDDGRKVSLTFVNTDLQEFVRIVFDEILKENVVVDAGLKGHVTIRTSEPVSTTAALGLVRNVLQVHGASMAKSANGYRISAQNGVVDGRRNPGAIRVVPLKYLQAEQARSALQSFMGNGTEVIANAAGRFLVLSGGEGEIENLLQMIETLDIDQMQGMAFALVPLKEASAANVSGELAQMFGQGNVGAFRALPIQRMNAVLLMSRTASLVTRAQDWIDRLDQAGTDTRKVHVYPVQNRRANEIADVLNGMLGTRAGSRQPRPEGSTTTPALTPVSMQSGAGEPPVQGSLPGMAPEAFPQGSTSDEQETHPDGADAAALREAVQIKADTATNSLVVIAKPEDYRLVEAAIRRLDVLPTQVLIEATIVEVALNDTLKHGVRWFFQYGNHGVSLADGSDAKSDDLPGFNYTFKVGSGKLVLNALESITDIEVISSPALTVLDNQTANLKVGDQVPVATRSARSVVNPDAPVVNDIEMKDTGIILSVTPRVNSSGLVMLDISQEASDVVQTETSAIDSPTIRQRKINSSIAAQSGSEIVLGGLISTRRTKGKSGVPILKDIPLLGTAFTSNAVTEQGRTELLIIIRPTVIGSRLDVHNITQEIKARMRGVSGALYGRS